MKAGEADKERLNPEPSVDLESLESGRALPVSNGCSTHLHMKTPQDTRGLVSTHPRRLSQEHWIPQFKDTCWDSHTLSAS